MTFSVNTNNGAAVALQYRHCHPGSVDQMQSRINSGLKVTPPVMMVRFTPSREPARQRGRRSGRHRLDQQCDSSVDVALSAGQSISDLLIQMKQKALSAADTSLDTASRQAMNANFVALRDQITTIVKNATFNGNNLVDGSTNQVSAGFGRRQPPHHLQQPEHEAVGGIVTVKVTSTIPRRPRLPRWLP